MFRRGDEDWTHYEGLADDVAIPTIGCRVLVYVNSDGKQSVTWCVDADKTQAYVLVGVLEEVKRNLLDDDDDEDDDEDAP